MRPKSGMQQHQQPDRNLSLNIELQNHMTAPQINQRPLSFSFEDQKGLPIYVPAQRTLTMPIYPIVGSQSFYYPNIMQGSRQVVVDPRRVMLEKFNQRFQSYRQLPQTMEGLTQEEEQNQFARSNRGMEQVASNCVIDQDTQIQHAIPRAGEGLKNTFNINQIFASHNDNTDADQVTTQPTGEKSGLNTLEDPAFWEETDYSEIDGLNIQSRLVRLKNLNNLLIQIFCGSEVDSAQYQLNELEENILNSLLMRKFFKRFRDESKRMTVDDKVHALNEIIKIKSVKRPEEFYKFVLTRVIKMLKRDFKSKVSTNSKNFEREFYEHYFRAVADRTQIPIEHFYYPLTGKTCKKKEAVSPSNNLNSEYYEKIFQSDIFVEEMCNYLDSLHSDYHREIIKKLESLLIKWDSELQDEKADRAKIQKKILDYLEKNKRCKLPWTLNEVDEAISRFKSHVTHIRNSHKN